MDRCVNLYAILQCSLGDRSDRKSYNTFTCEFIIQYFCIFLLRRSSILSSLSFNRTCDKTSTSKLQYNTINFYPPSHPSFPSSPHLILPPSLLASLLSSLPPSLPFSLLLSYASSLYNT